MKKAFKLLAALTVLTVLLIPTGCIMLVGGGGGDTYYGFGWTASLDSFESSAAPDSIKIKNTLGEPLSVKYKIFLHDNPNDYDKEIEPDWDTISVSKNLQAASGLVEVVPQINFIEKGVSYTDAVVWIRVQNADNSKYLAFSVQIQDASDTEWNITISKKK